MQRKALEDYAPGLLLKPRELCDEVGGDYFWSGPILIPLSAHVTAGDMDMHELIAVGIRPSSDDALLFVGFEDHSQKYGGAARVCPIFVHQGRMVKTFHVYTDADMHAEFEVISEPGPD